jgi:hypothetical protein
VAHAKDIWKITAPLKVRIFLWQLARDRLPAAQQIKSRHGPSNGNCFLCGRPKDVSHIFFNVPCCVAPQLNSSGVLSGQCSMLRGTPPISLTSS